MKNVIVEVTYFFNVPMINLLFYCHITLYREKVTSYKKFNQVLPLKPKLSGKFQLFNVIDGSIKILYIAEFPKLSIKMKNLKTF